jgi:hypothetical protein
MLRRRITLLHVDCCAYTGVVQGISLTRLDGFNNQPMRADEEVARNYERGTVVRRALQHGPVSSASGLANS